MWLDVDRLAGLGIGHEAVLGVPVLEVEELGHRARRAREGGMVRDVAHAHAVDPDLAFRPESVQELLSRACGHRCPPVPMRRAFAVASCFEEDERRARHAKLWSAYAMLPSSAKKLPVPAAYSLLILREFGTTPDVEAALLEGTEICPEQLAVPDAEMTLGQQLRMLHNANRILPAGWSVRLASRLHASTHGAIGLASVSAATLADAVAVNVRFASVRAPTIRWRSERSAREQTLVLEDRVAVDETIRTLIHEAVLLTVQGLVESVLGRADDRSAHRLGVRRAIVRRALR